MNYEYHFQVRLHDADPVGVMFFARFFTHAHDAYEDFMASLGLDLKSLIESGVRLPLAHASADYLAPVQHTEQIDVNLQVERLGETSFSLVYEFLSGHEVCARLRTVHVFLESQQTQPCALPEVFRRLLRPYLA